MLHRTCFFEIFNFPIIKGDKTGQLVRPNTVVLTESAASRYFDGEDPIGKVLTFSTSSSQQNFEVTGVIADMPVRSHLKYDFYFHIVRFLKNGRTFGTFMEFIPMFV